MKSWVSCSVSVTRNVYSGILLTAQWREGRWKCDVESDFTQYVAWLSRNADVTNSGHSTAGWFSHPASYSTRSWGHKRSRWFRWFPVCTSHGVRSFARSVHAGELDGSSSSCALHIHSSRPKRLIQPRLSRDWSFYLNSDGWWGLHFLWYLCTWNNTNITVVNNEAQNQILAWY